MPQARGNCCYCCHHGQRVVAQLRRQRELLHCTASPLMRAAAAAAGGAAAVAAAEASPADSSISCAAVGWHNAEPVQGYRQRRHISVHARRQSHSRARRNLRRCATAEAAVCDSGYDDVGSSSSYGLAVTLSCLASSSNLRNHSGCKYQMLGVPKFVRQGTLSVAGAQETRAPLSLGEMQPDQCHFRPHCLRSSRRYHLRSPEH